MSSKISHNEQRIKFHHCTQIQIRFNDIDIAGHVNNSIYFEYLNYSRMVYFKEVMGENIDWQKTGVVIVRMEIDYFEPIFINDEIEVCAHISKIGNKSIEMYQRIQKKDSEGNIKEIAFAKSILVVYDYVAQTSIPIPKKWKEILVNFEKNIVLKSN